MADSLDDFFAKKDKKRKNKSQTAALSAEALVRELEEGSKQSEYQNRREGKTSAAMELLGLDANDNDWKDFEEVERRDYSGLKVKEMSIQDQDEEQRRLTEHSEQVPETIPWKSKLDTVAAIISSKNEPDSALGELPEESEQPDEASLVKSATPTTTPVSSTLSKTDNTDEKVGTQIATSSTQPKSDDSTQKTEAPAESKDGQDASKNEGDTKPVVRKAYVPPHERMEKEFKSLEPIKLSKLRSSSSRPQAKINLDDTKMFPSLG